MTTFPVAPSVSTLPLLPGVDFVDAYALDIDEPTLDAVVAARRAFGRSPEWIRGLMALRNRIVAPFGLKRAASERTTPASPDRIGSFPVVSQSADRVVLGFDDRHLDFRIAVDVASTVEGLRRVTLTTLVRRRNWLGRAYLAVITPFHRVIAPAMLAQVAILTVPSPRARGEG
jgi:hypothetical protein